MRFVFSDKSLCHHTHVFNCLPFFSFKLLLFIRVEITGYYHWKVTANFVFLHAAFLGGGDGTWGSDLERFFYDVNQFFGNMVIS